MNQYFGWKQGSDMPATYVHLSGKSIDNAILQLNGMKNRAEIKEIEAKPINCPRCETINPAESRYCCKCAGLLDIKEALELEAKEIEKTKVKSNMDGLMNDLLKDPEVQQVIMQKLASMNHS